MATHDPQQANPRGRMLEYAEFVEDQVARACARIKSNDVFRASLWLVTVGLAVLFAEIVLDHLVELPLVVRRSIFYGGACLAVIYAGLRIVRPMFRRVNGLYAAKSIESVDSHFKNSLINYLRLREEADKIPPSVLKSIEARAVNDLTAVNVDDVIDPSPVTRLSYALAAIIVGLCLYSWMTPKNIWDSARRAFLADVARPTNTRFANVSPGEDPDAPKAVTGLPVNFSVETLGAQPDSVTLMTSRDGGKSFAETPMVKGRSFADPWTVTIDKAPGELHYYMAGGDGRTRTFKLEALPVALVESVTLDYDFPAYARAPRREGVTDGNVEALQGTKVTVTATTNQPARSGLLDFGPRPPVALVPLPGEPRKLRGTFVVDTNGQYSVRFNTTDGQTNPEPVLYDIRVVKDVSPTARFIRPETPTTRPANARVPLVVEASDDFGLTSAQLHVYKGSEMLQQVVELVDPKAKDAVKQLQATVSLDLEPLSLKEGDKIQYWLALKDNCEIQTNRFETPKQEIVIQAPVTEPEREQLAQNEMAQAKEDLGQQEPQPERQQGQTGQDSKAGQDSQNQESGSENKPGEQGQANKDRAPEDQGKSGQSKSGQGEETESASPNENAKPGGQQGKGQQTPSDEPGQGKNAQGKGQAGQGGDDSKADRQGDSKSGEKSGDSAKPQGERPNDASKNAGDSPRPKNEPGKQGQPDSGSQPGQNDRTGSEPDRERTKSGESAQKGEQKQGVSDPGEPSPDGQESGKAAPGQKPDGTERARSAEGDRKSDDPRNSQPGANEPSDQPKGKPGERAGQEKSADGNEPEKGERPAGQPGTEEKSGNSRNGDRKGLPQGEPREGKPNEDTRQKSLNDLTDQDREKLDRLRRALGMDDQPKSESGQPGQGEKQPSGVESKESDRNRDGQPGTSEEEKSRTGKSAGDEKGEQARSGGEEKSEASKSDAQSKSEAGKPGDEEKAKSGKSGGQEKPEAGESGAQSKSDTGKSGGQEKPEAGKSGGQSKSEAGKSGGEEKSEAGKSGGQSKSEAGKSGGKEKSDTGKSGGEEKSEAGKSGGEEKSEAGKSGDEEKSEAGKSGGQSKSDAGKSGGEEKSEAGKSGGQSKSEAGKSGGEEKSESGKSGGQDKSEGGKSGEQAKPAGEEKSEAGKEKGEDAGKSRQPSQGGQPRGQGDSKDGEGEKSKDEGEKPERPGGLPDGAPKNGGMREGSDGPAEKPDDSQPAPRAVEPEDQARNDLSPQQKADQRLLNRLRQMVDKNEITKDIEQATGLTREEIDQFVRNYEPPKEDRRTREPGDPGEIVAKPGEEQRDRRVTLPGETPDGKVLSRTGRGSGMVNQDEERGNLEGARSRVPSALRSRFEAYQKALSRASGGSGEPNPAASKGTSGGKSATGAGTNR